MRIATEEIDGMHKPNLAHQELTWCGDNSPYRVEWTNKQNRIIPQQKPLTATPTPPQAVALPVHDATTIACNLTHPHSPSAYHHWQLRDDRGQ